MNSEQYLGLVLNIESNKSEIVNQWFNWFH